MTKSNNYTGYAKPKKDGTLEAVSSYESVGMYQPCLYVENGVATSLLVGGFPKAGGTPISKEVEVEVFSLNAHNMVGILDIENWWKYNGCFYDREKVSGIPFDGNASEYLAKTDKWWASLSIKERKQVYYEFFEEA